MISLVIPLPKVLLLTWSWLVSVGSAQLFLAPIAICSIGVLFLNNISLVLRGLSATGLFFGRFLEALHLVGKGLLHRLVPLYGGILLVLLTLSRFTSTGARSFVVGQESR